MIFQATNSVRDQVLIVVHVTTLLCATFVFCLTTLQTSWVGLPLISLAAIVVTTINTVRLVGKRDREWSQFISNVSQGDFSTTTTVRTHSAGESFANAQQVLLSKFRQLQQDREIQHLYLQTVVKHIDVALICFDDDGKVEIINDAAQDLFGIYISNVRDLAKVDQLLCDTLKNIAAAGRVVLKTSFANELHILLLSATEITLLEKQYKLVSLQSIKNTLQESEFESWQKLIKVLTHEIMNSMTPIVSLSQYVERVVSQNSSLAQLADENSEQHRDVRRSIQAIVSRSRGLCEFVEGYRSLNQLPEPELSYVEVSSVFQRVKSLTARELEQHNVELVIQVADGNSALLVDQSQLEQILINLVNNAVDAVTNCAYPTIELRNQIDQRGSLVIEVVDNGCGMTQELMNDVFTPFFTSKPNGNGIGLSISRQLTNLNKGTLTLASEPGLGTTATLSFKGV